jgi:antitoxin VapB
MSLLIAPIASFDSISLDELNDALVAWGHKMGEWRRPPYRGFFHGLREHGRLVAVLAAGDLIRETAAGMSRAEAFELGRVCAVRPHLNRVALRLWREMVFPDLCRVHGWRWCISYQDAALHSGDLYRFDGWVRLAYSRSGNDHRSGRKGRNKWVWGWCDDAEARQAKRGQP